MSLGLCRLACLSFCCLAAPAALAAQPGGAWRMVASDKGRSIEVDTASIQREADGKVVATTRLVVDKEIVDPRSGAPYKAIQTSSRYDCGQRTAQTLKRSLIRANDEALRAEEIRTPVAMPVRSGTLEDRVLRELCRPPGPRGEAMRVADRASAAAAALRAANEDMLRRQVAAAERSRADRAPSPRVAGAVRHPGKAAAARNVAPAPAAQAPAQTLPWAYAGPGGPEHWADLDPEYALCRHGRRQSPINIEDGVVLDLEPIEFDYQASLFSIEDTPYGLEVRVSGNRLVLMGKSYELETVRFHRPAEESIAGRRFDMGVHLEHRAYDGERLIVAILFEAGETHPLIQTLWNYLPLEQGMRVSPPTVSIDLNRLLPVERGYHIYMGSLTRPPCSEGVLWVVLQQPVQVAAEQIAILARLHPDNARPVQPTHGRLIKSSRPRP